MERAWMTKGISLMLFKLSHLVILDAFLTDSIGFKAGMVYLPEWNCYDSDMEQITDYAAIFNFCKN